MNTTITQQGWNGTAFHDAAGAWMLSRDLESTFGIPQWQIDQWANARCPYLSGRRRIRRKKISNPLPGSIGLNGTVYVYLAADLQEIVAQQKTGTPVSGIDGKHLDADIFADAAGEKWISAPGAKRRMGMNIESLRRWAKRGCRYLDGRRVRTKKTEQRHRRPTLLFSLLDVEHIHARMPANAAPSPEHRDDEGVWLTNAQMRKRLGVSSIFCIDWSKKRWNGAPALRSKMVPDLRRMVNGTHVPVYLLSDAMAIASREKSESKYEGRGAISDQRQKGLAKEALRVLKLILAAGPMQISEAERIAAENHHIKASILHRARKAMGKKIITIRRKHGPGVWSLRGVMPKPAPAASTHLDLTAIGTVTIQRAARVKVKAKSAKVTTPTPKNADSADGSADAREKNRQQLPDSVDARDLAHELMRQLPSGEKSQRQIALEFTQQNAAKADSLLRIIRKYPLLHRAVKQAAANASK